jgi:hypothetical protein
VQHGFLQFMQLVQQGFGIAICLQACQLVLDGPLACEDGVEPAEPFFHLLEDRVPFMHDIGLGKVGDAQVPALCSTSAIAGNFTADDPQEGRFSRTVATGKGGTGLIGEGE